MGRMMIDSPHRFASGVENSAAAPLSNERVQPLLILPLLLVLVSSSLPAQVCFKGVNLDITGMSVEEACDKALLLLEAACGNSVLEKQWDRETSTGSIVLAYKQYSGSAPVRGGHARLLLSTDPPFRVQLFSARLVQIPDVTEFPKLRAADIVPLIGLTLESEGLDSWTDPQLEWIVCGPDGDRIRLVWSVIGYSSAPSHALALRFDIDALDGNCLATESVIEEVDVTGSLWALATLGTSPDQSANPESLIPLPNARVEIPGVAVGTSDELGNFVLSAPPAASWPVVAELVGAWGSVADLSSPGCSGSGQAFPGQPIDVILNPSGMVHDTSEVNAFMHTDCAFRFFQDSNAGFPAIQAGLQCNVNVPGVCNAFYNEADQSVNFFIEGSGCANASYSTIVTHEFGHYLVNQLGIAQGAFGEGFADSVSIVLNEEPIIGRDFGGPGFHIRDVAAAGVTYPCFGDVHHCGQLLAGFWWDLLEIMGSEFGPEEGWDRTAILFRDWASITSGGFGGQPFHEFMVQEILSVDDDDADLTNGSTHYWQIREAALGRNVAVPPVVSLVVEITEPLPEFVLPLTAYPIDVTIFDSAGTYIPSSGKLLYRFGSGIVQEIPLLALGGFFHQAILPPSDCGTEISWCLNASSSFGDTIQIPTEGMFAPFRTPVGDTIVTVLDSPLEDSTGWNLSVSGDDATSGAWEHGIPIGTLSQSSGDHSPGAGTEKCFATGIGFPGGATGDSDVDGGATTLTSPAFPVADGLTHRTEISYWRWYVNDGSAAPPDDSLVVQCTPDDGITWYSVEVLGPGDEDASGGWEEHVFWLDQVAPPSSEIRLRFIASDHGFGNIVEAAIDDLKIRHLQCSSTPVPAVNFRRGDCNSDGGIDVSDPILLIEHLFGASGPLPCADSCDVDDGGVLDLQDSIVLLQLVFGMGSVPIAPPAVTCGSDPVVDLLDCLQGTPCP